MSENEVNLQQNDEYWMQQAYEQAASAALQGEIPVGAVFVSQNQVIGAGFNAPITLNDPTAHAEIQALRQACQHIQNYRLPEDTTLYVTLEPCTMCIGALIHARVDRLIYAASEPRAGMVGSQMNLAAESFYNHRIQVYKGLCREHSSQMLKAFFRQRRQASKRKER